jgi:hypothetical protein
MVKCGASAVDDLESGRLSYFQKKKSDSMFNQIVLPFRRVNSPALGPARWRTPPISSSLCGARNVQVHPAKSYLARHIRFLLSTPSPPALSPRAYRTSSGTVQTRVEAIEPADHEGTSGQPRVSAFVAFGEYPILFEDDARKAETRSFGM